MGIAVKGMDHSFFLQNILNDFNVFQMGFKIRFLLSPPKIVHTENLIVVDSMCRLVWEN